MDYTEKQKLIYRRQYILSPEKIRPSFLFNETAIGAGYTLYSQIDLKISILKKHDLTIVLMGDIFSYESPGKNNDEILDEIYDRDLVSFIRKTEKYTGRYVIIHCLNDDLNLFTDCIAARKIFYTTDRPKTWFASQPHLLAEVTGSEMTTNQMLLAYYNSPVFNKLFNANIGDLSCYDNIRQLRINHYYDLSLKTSVRFWPYQKIKRRPLNDVAAECCSIIKGYCSAVSKRYDKIMLPLTGGKDSRTLYAAIKDNDVKIYCYLNDDGTAESDDFATPRSILLKDGREFHVESLPVNLDPDFTGIYYRNNPMASERFLPLIYNYYNKFEDYINLPGNIASAGLEFYKFSPWEISGRQLAHLNYVPDFPFAIDYYNQWLNSVKDLCRQTGINILSLFYWEERLGNWGTQVQIDKDIAQEDFNLLNSYDYIGRFFSVKPTFTMPPDYKLHKKIIEILCKECMEVPFNIPSHYTLKSLMQKTGLLKFVYKVRFKIKARQRSGKGFN